MGERLIINGKGEEREILQFPNKKEVIYDYKRTTKFLEEARKLQKEAEVGQREAEWTPNLQYPNLPFALLLMSDIHYGSVHTDYELLDKHLEIVENTPNTFVAFNGDEVDNFAPTLGKAASGVLENPLPPHFQAKAFFQRVLELDRKDKVAVLGQGNHNYFGFPAGQDFYETFASELKAPIFTEGGLLKINTPAYQYRIFMNHTYWGRSKINLTNSAKRMIEYEGAGNVDAGWLGHCFADDVEILTPNGWKKGMEIKKGDIVGTMNIKNGEFEFNQVKEKFVYNNYTKLLNFKNDHADIRVTNGHTMVYSNYYSKGRLKGKQHWMKVNAKTLSKRKAPYAIPLAAINNKNDYKITDDEIRLVGWLIAEGHFRRNGAVQLYQSVGIKANLIMELLNRLNLKYSIYRRKTAGKKLIDPRTKKIYYTKNDTLAFYITIKDSKPIIKLIKNKRLPQWCFSLSRRQVDILLEAMCLGDGVICKKGNRDNMTYYSIDIVLLNQIQALCAMNGLRSTLTERDKKGGYVSISKTPHLWVEGTERNSFKEVSYKGSVWCVSVPNGTLVVRNKGKVIITGNSHESSYEYFTKGGKDIIAIVSGTYKVDDKWSARNGIGNRAGHPGISLMFWPNERKIEVFKDIQNAQEFITGQIYLAELKKVHK